MFEYLNEPQTIKTIVTIGSMSLLFIGLFGLLTQKHFIKIFMSIAIMESSIFLFFIGNIFNKDFTAPLISASFSNILKMNDPIPHAMILTAIVISMAVLALGVSFAIEYYRLTGNTNIDKMNEMRH
jgi:multisubunit Na+/H+ antiporter MnhC subunit